MDFSIFKRNLVQNMHTIAFYNLENLFDALLTEATRDLDFTPEGSRKWTPRRYQRKLERLASVIGTIGLEESGKPPVLLGVAEVENGTVVQQLLDTPPLNGYNYGYVHYNSPDDRGMDTALIYSRDHFKVLKSQPIPLLLQASNGEPEATRDILYVQGELNGQVLHIFVNHWPSRRTGNLESDYKRLLAAKTIISFMDGIEAEFKEPSYVVMGDFNDGPTAESVQALMDTDKLYNPMQDLYSRSRGSVRYRGSWNLFDQIMLSKGFLTDRNGGHRYIGANIFDEAFLKEAKGKYKGTPFRTYRGGGYKGGYSDHFPVYVQLMLNS